MAEAFPNNAKYTLPGLTAEQGNHIATILQDRLWALNDLQLVLKHAHWNVVGPNFIGVHEMLDPEVEAIRANADAVAERIAEYREAVTDYEVAFDLAEREARRVRDSQFSETERKRLATAQQLLAVALDQSATPAERQIAGAHQDEIPTERSAHRSCRCVDRSGQSPIDAEILVDRPDGEMLCL